ncbi:hypothetical protein FHETE_4693 [Fusarium heterosporum]|uniref:Uncharacterized protein n=1 Tax=Fusarium heterosporum TaxID=42747 RepID=A0A8H5WT41_FUSHE|nr:hypothetical protein FHETE_4693 [Fusarium heterosporum]
MKFSLPAIVAFSLLGASHASRIELHTTTGPAIIPIYSSAYYDDAGESYPLGAFRDGCRKTDYGWIKQICIDDPKERAHVIYSGGSKNCYKVTKSTSKNCGGPSACWSGVCQRCWTAVYTKTPCTWRSLDDTEATDEEEST